MKEKIIILKGDITDLDVDAIVNAANPTLLGGGGVDGAIHRKAGPQLLAECVTLLGCKTGEAKITKGYKLKAKYVIHTVGPVWKDGTKNEDKLLANCYRNSLELAEKNSIKSIAFPAISTGVYGFPFERASEIAIKTVKCFLQNNVNIKKVIFILFSIDYFKEFNNILNRLLLNNEK